MPIKIKIIKIPTVDNIIRPILGTPTVKLIKIDNVKLNNKTEITTAVITYFLLSL